jgi:hypothetical protein
MPRRRAMPIRRGPGYLWAKARVESKRVDEFAKMSDEELERYVYGNKELDRR